MMTEVKNIVLKPFDEFCKDDCPNCKFGELHDNTSCKDAYYLSLIESLVEAIIPLKNCVNCAGKENCSVFSPSSSICDDWR